MVLRPITADLAYLTPDLPGIGGCVRQSAEDFLVYEQPLREPSGRGDYLWLYVERRHQMTTDAARRIAKMFGVSLAEIGYAGLKDKHAVTRQHFSVHLPDASREARLGRFEFTGMRLLWARRDQRPLVRGDLRGNDFTVRVRQPHPQAPSRMAAVLEKLGTAGLPNYFGYQRFGYRQNNHLLGALLVRERWEEFLEHLLGGVRPEDQSPLAEARCEYRGGNYERALELWPHSLRHDRQALDAIRQRRAPREAVMSLDAQQRRFLISALQSAMFNWVLDRRVRDGLLERFVPGDVVASQNRKEFTVLDAAGAAQANEAAAMTGRLALSPTGPMWAPNMPEAGDQVALWEQEALATMGLSVADVARFPQAAAVTEFGALGGPQDPVVGTRRPLRVQVENLSWREDSDAGGHYVELSFFLPRGCFATALLREVMKSEDLSGRCCG